MNRFHNKQPHKNGKEFAKVRKLIKVKQQIEVTDIIKKVKETKDKNK